MSDTQLADVVEPIEMLPPWHGEVIVNPKAFIGPTEREAFLTDPSSVGEAGNWIARTIGGAFLARSKDIGPIPAIVSFLRSWDDRHGRAKLVELQAAVHEAVKQGRAEGDEPHRRIDEHFAAAVS